MIFSPPRFAVIDDKIEHLTAITKAVESLGAACIGLHYNPDEADNGIKPLLLRGVRCLFVDLHLLLGAVVPGSDDSSIYAMIATLLQENMNDNGGPYILILWTEHPHKVDGLRAYFDSAGTFTLENQAKKPVAILCLSKTAFINTYTGVVSDASKLKEAIYKELQGQAPFAALLSWEVDVHTAVKDVLAALLDLIPCDKKKVSIYSQELGIRLRRLANEAHGKQNVVDPRAAVTGALIPILSDRILNRQTLQSEKDFWTKALNIAPKNMSPASSEEAGRINKMLHLASATSEAIRPIDWGAIVECPFWADADSVKDVTGFRPNGIVRDEFCIDANNVNDCTPVLIRVGAACDFAQNKSGQLMYILGMKIPENTPCKTNPDGKLCQRSDAIWESPVFKDQDSDELFRICAHIRFVFTYPPAKAKNFTPLYRFREQLLIQLISKGSQHIARPGIISIPSP